MTSSVMRTRFFVFFEAGFEASCCKGVLAGGSSDISNMGANLSISPTGFFVRVLNAVEMRDKKRFRSSALSFELSVIINSNVKSSFFLAIGFALSFSKMDVFADMVLI